MNRILVAVHGYEPRGWADHVLRALPSAGPSAVRVLVVVDAPSPPFTSLLPAARRRYAAARAEWQRLARAQMQLAVAALEAALTAPPEIEHVVAAGGQPGRAIVEHARRWGADLLVVGRDTRDRIARGLSRAAHERVVDSAPCAVFVTPAAPPLASDPLYLGRPRVGHRWPSAMGGA
ncbi:MAG: universal stress protein [Candidatus Rokubacteria bacterium]|nr:universal stress protein [Candidatus Rokubacteria bacterium]